MSSKIKNFIQDLIVETETTAETTTSNTEITTTDEVEYLRERERNVLMRCQSIFEIS